MRQALLITLEAMYSPNQDQKPGVILDPSCGVGSFLAETLRVLYEQAKNRMRQEDLHRWATSTLKNNIIGIDKSERMIRLATANLALFGAPATNLHLANSLVRGGTDGELSQTLNGRAILILTNPPFGATFSSTDLSGYQMAGYQMAQGENNQHRDLPRSLAGKPLAGFRATPDRRIIVLCGMLVSVIRCKNPLVHR